MDSDNDNQHLHGAFRDVGIAFETWGLFLSWGFGPEQLLLEGRVPILDSNKHQYSTQKKMPKRWKAGNDGKKHYLYNSHPGKTFKYLFGSYL